MNRSWVGRMRKTIGCHLHKGRWEAEKVNERERTLYENTLTRVMYFMERRRRTFALTDSSNIY